ncbi:hypothetical protein L3Q82_006966 [Scortum barcoo]|uniref:Uncharacterized protein n=1 Tax=Scortum barcoo TaxID=214431 RepID=A0ACB8WVP7_9TELE|nr:hypothetical protein L3Q82_006966 [Scortum barcoo]
MQTQKQNQYTAMADKMGCEDEEKSIYLIQIDYLEEQLDRCQLKHGELEKQNKELLDQYAALENDKRDVTEPLKRSVVAKERKLEELAERLEGQREAARRDADALKLQHCQQIRQLQHRVEELKSESEMIAAELEKKQEEKKELMQQVQPGDIESLEEQIALQQGEHKAAVDKLMNDTELQIKRITEEGQDMLKEGVRMQASSILQRERNRHVRRTKQLPFLRKETVKLQEEKDALQCRTGKLNKECADLKEELSKIFLDYCALKTEEQCLWKKWQKAEAELTELIVKMNNLIPQIENLREELVLVPEQSHRDAVRAGQLEAELQEETNRTRVLHRAVEEAVIVLRHILTTLEKYSESLLKILSSIIAVSEVRFGLDLDQKPLYVYVYGLLKPA